MRISINTQDPSGMVFIEVGDDLGNSACFHLQQATFARLRNPDTLISEFRETIEREADRIAELLGILKDDQGFRELREAFRSHQED